MDASGYLVDNLWITLAFCNQKYYIVGS